MQVYQCQSEVGYVTKDIKHFQAERLKDFREQLGRTQPELDRLCGFSAGSIQRYEAGTSQPGADALYKLAAVLQTSADYLLGLTENREPSTERRVLTQGEHALLALYRNDLRWEVVMRMAQEATEREKLKNIPPKPEE